MWVLSYLLCNDPLGKNNERFTYRLDSGANEPPVLRVGQFSSRVISEMITSHPQAVMGNPLFPREVEWVVLG